MPRDDPLHTPVSEFFEHGHKASGVDFQDQGEGGFSQAGNAGSFQRDVTGCGLSQRICGGLDECRAVSLTKIGIVLHPKNE